MGKKVQNTVINDASSRVEGFLYQFYVALKYCFELKESEKLYIEKYGDVTVKGKAQIEVKKYSNPLTDSHDNLWQTLHNWSDYSFNPSAYKYLVLLTTQQIGATSLLKGWNEKNKEEKISAIVSIANSYRDKNENSESTSVLAKIAMMQSIISPENMDRLETILEKFSIIDCSLGFIDVYEDLKERYARHIPENNRDHYLNSLLGYILNPKVVSNNWEITNEDFSEFVKVQTSIYHQGTIIFPKIKREFSQDEIDQKKTSLFVRKIDDIDYEDQKNVAIKDYLYTNNLLLNELSCYKFDPSIMTNYETELLNSYRPKRRLHNRKLSPSADSTEIVRESQDFYDDVTGEKAQSFVNFNDTPMQFRNGFYHIMAEENDEIIWLLKRNDNDDKTI